jgi:hypothetical protein
MDVNNTDVGAQVSVPGGKAFSMGTLAPNQQNALNQLISQLSGGTATSFNGALSANQSNLERTSLQALEERALNLESPSALNQALESYLTGALDPSRSMQDVSGYFDSNIQAPALRSFQEQVLPSIGRNFGGADFFSSERQGADQAAQRELIDSLTRSRAEIQYQEYTNAQNRALQAAGLTNQYNQQQLQQETELYAAGQQETQRQQAGIDREYGEFVRQQGAKATDRQQLLESIRTPTKENMLATKSGTSGGGNTAAAIGAVATVAAAFLSDKTKKTSIKKIATPVLDALENMPEIKSWKYKKGASKDQARHIGPMAQDFKKAFGVGDGKQISIIDAVGVLMKGLQEYAEERG